MTESPTFNFEKTFSVVGKNKTCCRGHYRVPAGFQTIIWMFMVVLIVVFSALYAAFIVPLEIKNSRYSTVAISLALGVITVILFFFASLKDPGVLPRKAAIILASTTDDNIQKVKQLLWPLYSDILEAPPEKTLEAPAYVQRPAVVTPAPEVSLPQVAPLATVRTTDTDLSGVLELIDENNFSLQSLYDAEDCNFKYRKGRWCRSCMVWRPKKCSHCRDCDSCVLDFDHHCQVVGACIGSGNHRYFIWFAFVGCLYGAFGGSLAIYHFIKQVQDTPPLSPETSRITLGWGLGLGIPLFIVTTMVWCRRRYFDCWPAIPLLFGGLCALVVYLYAKGDIAVHPMVVLLAVTPWAFALWGLVVALWQMQLIGHSLNVKQRAVAQRAGVPSRRTTPAVRELAQAPFKIGLVLKFLFTCPPPALMPKLQALAEMR